MMLAIWLCGYQNRGDNHEADTVPNNSTAGTDGNEGTVDDIGIIRNGARDHRVLNKRWSGVASSSRRRRQDPGDHAVAVRI